MELDYIFMCNFVKLLKKELVKMDNEYRNYVFKF